MRLFAPMLLLAAVHCFPAAAQDCANAGDQATMTQCAGMELEAADAALNAAWAELMERLAGDAEAKRALTAAQKAWIGFRDAECAFRASGGAGGSIHSMLVAQCLSELTEARTAELEAYLACEEGDLACPVPSAG